MRFFKHLLLLYILFLLVACGDDTKNENERLIDQEKFEHANLKYKCPVCNEKSALFCPDCTSDKLIWCHDGHYVNSVYCKDCKAILYPMDATCFSCDKNMRADKSCFSSKSKENHPDCQAGIDYNQANDKAQKEFDQSIEDLQRDLNQLEESSQYYDDY